MAEDGSKQQSNTWPMTKFYFSVIIGDAAFIFQEVTGISSETQVMYGDGNSTTYPTVKMPGIKKYGNVTLKKGIFKGSQAVWDKYNLTRMNTMKRETVVISLLDEANGPVMTWTLQNAFPVKMAVTDAISDADEIAIEIMDLAHEGISEAI